jgi:hypothetical protein
MGREEVGAEADTVFMEEQTSSICQNCGTPVIPPLGICPTKSLGTLKQNACLLELVFTEPWSCARCSSKVSLELIHRMSSGRWDHSPHFSICVTTKGTTCLSRGEGLHKLWSIHQIEDYAAIKLSKEQSPGAASSKRQVHMIGRVWCALAQSSLKDMFGCVYVCVCIHIQVYSCIYRHTCVYVCLIYMLKFPKTSLKRFKGGG